MNRTKNNIKQKQKAVIKTIYTLVNKKKMKDRSFTYAKIVKLIELYQQHECLWNISSPDFRRPEKRQDALSTIATAFDISPVEVKRKIRSLRATYLLERRKVLASEQKVQNGTETILYEPILAWYRYMNFLDDIIIFRAPAAAENATKKTHEQSDDVNQAKTEDPQLVKVEEFFYNDDSNYRRDEIMPAEYLDAMYLCEETMDPPDCLNNAEEALNALADIQDNQEPLQKDEETLTSLNVDKIRAEIEYFRKKAQYMDICIEKEKEMQPLVVEKLKLEIEILKRRLPPVRNEDRSHFNL